MTPSTLAANERPTGTIEVLIVEDSGPMLRLMGRLVERLGYYVHLASDGHEAMAIMARHRISIVISAWMMPEGDGVELCREIRKSRPDHYVYIILMTGDSLKSGYIHAMNAGADDFFPQTPFDFDHLVVRLRAARRVIELEHGLRGEHEQLKQLYRQMETELRAAARLQSEFLPADRRYGAFELRSLLVPASIISGDCHNHFALPGGKILAYQADIAGHGITAALLSVALQRALTPSFCCGSNGEVLQAAQIVHRLNQRLQSNTDTPEYFTLFLTIVSPETGLLSFCQAGHPPPALLRAGGRVEWIGEGGFPVGMLADADYDEGTCQLAAGDQLIIFSDGVTECPNPSGENLGCERLGDMLGRAATMAKPDGTSTEMEVLQQLKDWHGSYPFADDVSMLSISASR
jgi:sigma-B regulation protein RsbU (phosphoserine phosphatase)